MITSKANPINKNPNQIVITSVFSIDGYPRTVREFFQSYGKTIAMKITSYKKGCDYYHSQKTYIDKNYWDYSTTTGRYRNIYLAEPKRKTYKKIKSGEYILENLN